jgi:hypothetical protein
MAYAETVVEEAKECGCPERDAEKRTTWRQRASHGAILGTVLAAAMAAGGVDAAAASSAKSELRGLRKAPCPPPAKPLGNPRFSRTAVEDARKRHLFNVGFRSVRVRLVPPVDWLQDPYHSNRFRNGLQSLKWLDVLRYDYRRGRVGALMQAKRLLLDWIHRQKRGAPGTSSAAWRSKVTGERSAQLGYLVRAAACEHRLRKRQALAALRSVRAHARRLIDNFDHNNHGLFDSIALVALGRQFRFMAGAGRWRDLGARRFLDLFHERVIEREGFWLENSSAYHFLITDLLDQFRSIARQRRPGLRRLLRRMKDVGGWLIEPDHQIPQFGDSHLITPRRTFQRRAANDRGMLALMRSGIAVIKHPGAFLSMLADFHNGTHKHADELSFDLFDHGRRIVTDTGEYQIPPGPIRNFVVSPRAHSTLTVEGHDVSPRGRPPYGSGLQARGRQGSWFAVRGKNPLLRRAGVRHWRLFLYKPHVALILVDSVRANRSHTYSRYFQLGPDVDVTPDGTTALNLQAPGFTGSLYSQSSAGSETWTMARGSDDPLTGWTSPSYRQFVPRWTVRLTSSGEDLEYVTTISLNPTRLRASLGRVGQRRVELSLSSLGGPAGTLSVRRHDSHLSVNRHP